MQLMTLALITVLASSSGWTPNCVTETSDFDFYATSPQKYSSGTSEQVAQAYKGLADAIGDPKWYAKPTMFYVTDAYSAFTRTECAGEKCTAMDILTGLQRCQSGAETGADACLPIAAVYNSKVYCLLEPSQEGLDADQPFRPYE